MRCCSCMEHLVSTKLVLGSVPSSQVVPESYVDLAPVRGTNTALTVSSAFCPTVQVSFSRLGRQMKQFYTKPLAPSTPNESASIPEPSPTSLVDKLFGGTELLMEIGHIQ
jgi:hypothetical protein